MRLHFCSDLVDDVVKRGVLVLGFAKCHAFIFEHLGRVSLEAGHRLKEGFLGFVSFKVLVQLHELAELGEALATLRRYDQGLLSEKQVARAMDRLFARGRDDELRNAFRYFLPAELAV